MARGHTLLGPIGYGKIFGFFFCFIPQKSLKDFKQETSVDVVKKMELENPVRRLQQ